MENKKKLIQPMKGKPCLGKKVNNLFYNSDLFSKLYIKEAK